MFIIPCKYTQHCPLLETVSSIIKFYPDEKIVIVDSDSADKSYFDQYRALSNNIIVEDAKNVNYVDGALWYCYEKYTDEKFYYLLQDSTVLNQHLGDVHEKDITIISSFPLQYNEQAYGNSMLEWCEISLKQTQYEFLSHYEPVSFTTMFISRNLLDRMHEKGMSKILPTNRLEMEGTERLWGCCLTQEGYAKIPALVNSPSEWTNYSNISNSKFIKKIYMSYTNHNRP